MSPSTSALEPSELLLFAHDAAEAAGVEMVRRRATGDDVATVKDDRSFVTEADIACDAIITTRIRNRYPDHALLSEESAPSLTKEALGGPLWVIDPIDGTTNYARHSNYCAVSIAFCDEHGPLVGVVHAPFMNETFHGVRGGGAFRNGEPIAPARTSPLSRALVATGFHPGLRTALERDVRRIGAVLAHCHDVRRSGSAAIDTCWVACGRIDAYYETIHAWDIAAARLIAVEAGALAGHTAGPPKDSLFREELEGEEFLVASPTVYSELREILMGCE